ncbi:MAG: helix-turn-helix transcriptional regulator [Thermomicrobiales bacterium]
MDQAEFAAALGVNPKSIGAWELDSWQPRGIVGLAKRIQAVYGVPTSWTLGLDDQTADDEWAHWESNPEPAGSTSNVVTGLFLHVDELAHVPDRDQPAEVIDLTAYRLPQADQAVTR